MRNGFKIQFSGVATVLPSVWLVKGALAVGERVRKKTGFEDSAADLFVEIDFGLECVAEPLLGIEQADGFFEALADDADGAEGIGLDQRGEVADSHDFVIGKQDLGDGAGIDPADAEATGSVVEVEAIDVEDGLHGKKQGPRLAATAPRPFAEATRRDDGNNLVDGLTIVKTGRRGAVARRTKGGRRERSFC